ncbi:MAG: hypothetical protein HZY79_00390 [Rhodoblastus sp.]|nr:MAG: hypothetical protein HZY79_00390 [Rhodoblastus sp.]
MRVELILEAIDRATRPIQAVRQALAGVEAANRASTAAAPVKAMTQMRGAASAALAPMRALSIATTAYGGAARGVSARAEATAKALAGVNAAAQAGASPFTALTGAAGAHFAQIGRSTAALDAWRASATTAGVQAQHSAMQAARAMRAASSPVRGTFGQVSAAFAPMRRAPAWRASVPALPPPPPPSADAAGTARENARKARAARSDRQSQLVGALGIAASVAAPMTKAVAAWNAYEDILTDVGLKADLSGPKLAALGEKARAQARALNMSGTDILKGVDQLAAGGMAVADAVASFPR